MNPNAPSFIPLLPTRSDGGASAVYKNGLDVVKDGLSNKQVILSSTSTCQGICNSYNNKENINHVDYCGASHDVVPAEVLSIDRNFSNENVNNNYTTGGDESHSIEKDEEFSSLAASEMHVDLAEKATTHHLYGNTPPTILKTAGNDFATQKVLSPDAVPFEGVLGRRGPINRKLLFFPNDLKTSPSPQISHSPNNGTGHFSIYPCSTSARHLQTNKHGNANEAVRIFIPPPSMPYVTSFPKEMINTPQGRLYNFDQEPYVIPSHIIHHSIVSPTIGTADKTRCCHPNSQLTTPTVRVGHRSQQGKYDLMNCFQKNKSPKNERDSVVPSECHRDRRTQEESFMAVLNRSDICSSPIIRNILPEVCNIQRSPFKKRKMSQNKDFVVCVGDKTNETVCPNEEERRRIDQRTKQISYGKNTDGFRNMLRLLNNDPRLAKGGVIPLSPPRVEMKATKRTWDMLVRKWRRTLHMFDHVFIDTEDEGVTTKESVLEEQRKKWISPVFYNVCLSPNKFLSSRRMLYDCEAQNSGIIEHNDITTTLKKDSGECDTDHLYHQSSTVVRAERLRIPVDIIFSKRHSPLVPTRIPAEDNLRHLLRSNDCYESVSTVIPDQVLYHCKGQLFSPSDAGIKIVIAPCTVAAPYASVRSPIPDAPDFAPALMFKLNQSNTVLSKNASHQSPENFVSPNLLARKRHLSSTGVSNVTTLENRQSSQHTSPRRIIRHQKVYALSTEKPTLIPKDMKYDPTIMSTIFTENYTPEGIKSVRISNSALNLRNFDTTKLVASSMSESGCCYANNNARMESSICVASSPQTVSKALLLGDYEGISKKVEEVYCESVTAKVHHSIISDTSNTSYEKMKENKSEEEDTVPVRLNFMSGDISTSREVT